jgi:hypothetical protein
MTSYRVQYTERKPGGSLVDQDERITGTLDDVRDLLDYRPVAGHIAPMVTEYTESDSVGRIVPASEWDI